MTLILVIPSKEGVVMASDGQVTLVDVKTQAKKIKKLNENCVWGAAGDLPLIQLVEGRIAEFVYTNGMSVMLEDVPFAIGSGTPFAFTLFQKYLKLIPAGIDNRLAAVLAYGIIAETIEVTIGVGPPIDVWQLQPAENLTREKLTGIEETYLGLRKAEIEMFLGASK